LLISIRNVNPGGWLECADLDLILYTNGGLFTNDCPVGQWAIQLAQGVQKLGMEPYPTQKLEGWMRDAGFINIKYELLPMPVGPWPKDKDMVKAPSSDTLLTQNRKRLARTM
jgi:hypothetical protein